MFHGTSFEELRGFMMRFSYLELLVLAWRGLSLYSRNKTGKAKLRAFTPGNLAQREGS